jgi:hypothetical protein
MMRWLSTPVALLLLLLLSQPSLMGKRFSPAASQPGVASAATEEIPTIAFCEMVKNPRRYFDKTVRLTAVLEQATEAQYLRDEGCVLSRDEQIGARHLYTTDELRDLYNSSVNKIRTIEYGSRAKVTVIGVLRNSSRRDFAWYRYRFDIIRFEDISHLVVPYQGSLEAGKTYLAAVRGEHTDGLSLVIPLRIAEHHAVRIEWTNLSAFPALKQLGDSSTEQMIVFSVISDQIKQMTERRWNRTIRCKIISIG